MTAIQWSSRFMVDYIFSCSRSCITIEKKRLLQFLFLANFKMQSHLPHFNMWNMIISIGIHACEGKRFPHADFAMCLSWSSRLLHWPHNWKKLTPGSWRTTFLKSLAVTCLSTTAWKFLVKPLEDKPERLAKKSVMLANSVVRKEGDHRLFYLNGCQ